MGKKVFKRGTLFFLSGVLTFLSIATLGAVNARDRERDPLTPREHRIEVNLGEQRENREFKENIRWNTKVKNITGGTTYFFAGIATISGTLATQSSDTFRKDIYGWITVGAAGMVLLSKAIEKCLIGDNERKMDGQIADVLHPQGGVEAHADFPLPSREAIADALRSRSEQCRL
jgi:hypothetical protein